MRLNKQATEIAMAERGYNQIDLANAMGLSRQRVAHYLEGNPLRPKAAKRFADALGAPVRDLLEPEPEKTG